MSDKLQIHFDSDMPPATVEIVAPNLETVQRVLLRPGRSAEVDVPSEQSFLRVHMPSGKVVTLHDPGNLDRLINFNMLQEKEEKHSVKNNWRPYSSASTVEITDDHPRLVVALSKWNGEPIPGFEVTTKETAQLSNIRSMEPLSLQIYHEDRQLTVQLPGQLSGVQVRVTQLENDLRFVSIQVRTYSPEADTLGGYIARGDLHSAAAMTTWAADAEELLYGKMDNPFAAAIGAYLLLRLRRFELMRTWARNLADRFPLLADGSVIWAWQQIHQRRDEKTIRDYLFKAATNPNLPVFTEGLKLLGDGLRLLGPAGLELQSKLNDKSGLVLWDSPFTSSVKGPFTDLAKPVKFNIGYDLGSSLE